MLGVVALALASCGGGKKKTGLVCQSQTECPSGSICTSGECAQVCTSMQCGTGQICVLLADTPQCVADPTYVPPSPDVSDATDTGSEDTGGPDKSGSEDSLVSVDTADQIDVPDTSWAQAGCGTLPAGQEKVAYSGQLDVAAGEGYNLTVQGLPPGIQVSPSGALSGTPTTPGTFDVTVIVQNKVSGLKSTANCQLVIKATPITLACGTIPVGTLGKPYPAHEGFLKNAKNVRGTPTFTLTGLPAGLTYAANTGVISGTPSEVANAKSFEVKIVDGLGTQATTNCAITIVEPLALAVPNGFTLSSNGCFYSLSKGQSVDLKTWIKGGDPSGGTTYTVNTTLGGVTPPGTTLSNGVLSIPANTPVGMWGFHVDIERGGEAVNVAFGVFVADPGSPLKLRRSNGTPLVAIPEVPFGGAYDIDLFVENAPAYVCTETTPNNWQCNAWYGLHFEYNFKEVFGPLGDCGTRCTTNQVCVLNTGGGFGDQAARCVDKLTSCGSCSNTQAICIDPDQTGATCTIGNFVVGTVQRPADAVGGNPATYPFTLTQPFALNSGWTLPASLDKLKGQCMWFAVTWWLCVSPDQACTQNLLTSPTIRTTTVLSVGVPSN